MKSRSLLPTVLAASAIAAGCGNSRLPPASSGDDGTGAIDAGRFDASATSPGDDAALSLDSFSEASIEASADASADSAGAADSASDADEAGPTFAPECDETNTWSTTLRVPSIAPTGFDRLGAISANERTVAWTTSAGAIFVADRASASADFGAPGQLDPGATALANDRVALTADGMELLATLASGRSFARFVRASVGAAWTAGSADQFKFIAATISESGGAFSQPVVSADGLSLFYLLRIGTALPVFYEAPWEPAAKVWATGTPLPNPDFAIASAMQLRRPTGASSDRRTLFFFDEVAGHERAAWRDLPTSPFDFFAELPLAPEAAPAGNCGSLYFHGSDATGQGLFTAQ